MEISAARFRVGIARLFAPTTRIDVVLGQIDTLKKSFHRDPAVGEKLDSLKSAITQRVDEETTKAKENGTSIPEAFQEQFFQEIQGRLKDIVLDGTNPREIEKLTQDIQGCSFHEVVDKVQKIAAGKVKDIWARKILGRHVYSTARVSKGLLGRIKGALKRAELKGEVGVAHQVAQALQEKGDRPDQNLAEENLSLDFEEVHEERKQIQGQYTLRSKRASGDLEGKFTPTATPSIDPRHFNADLLDFGGQILKGVRDLHRAGYVHGDLKLQNLLFYPQERQGCQVKVADFGKARKMGPGQTGMHTGNPRYASPEGSISQKGEVFSAGIMLIRALESHYLTVEHSMLISPKESKKGFAGSKRIGIERFLIQSKKCPQKESLSLLGRVSVLMTRFGRFVVGRKTTPKEDAKVPDEPFKEEVKLYIAALIQKLADNDPKPDFTELMKLHELLVSMTDPDPEKRPDMETAYTRYQDIMKNLFPAKPEVTT